MKNRYLSMVLAVAAGTAGVAPTTNALAQTRAASPPSGRTAGPTRYAPPPPVEPPKRHVPQTADTPTRDQRQTIPTRTRAPECEAPDLAEDPPELEAGCPIPTLEECQAPGYLSGKLDDALGCGQLQATNHWTCAALFESAYACESAGWQKEPSEIADSLVSTGVAGSVADIPLGMDGSPEPYYVADLQSIQSQEAAVSFAEELVSSEPGLTAATYFDSNYTPGGGGGGIGVGGPVVVAAPGQQGGGGSPAVGGPTDIGYDIYSQYKANGTAFASCFEYVYEGFYEVNEYWREVSHYRNDHRVAFEKAFAPWSKTYALGTHHLDGSGFLSYNSQEFAPSHKVEPRNRFFDLPAYPQLPNEEDAVNVASLHHAMGGYSLASLLLVARVNVNKSNVVKDMAWHKLMSESLTVEDRPGPQLVNPQPPPPEDPDPGTVFTAIPSVPPVATMDELQAELPPTPELDPAVTAITGTVPLEVSDGKPMRRYFDAELNELDRLADRKDALLRQWALLNVKYRDSGWTIGDLNAALRPPSDDDDDDDPPSRNPGTVLAGTPPTTPPNRGPFRGPGSYAAEDNGPDGTPVPDWSPTDYKAVPVLSAENAARKRVLDELVDVYLLANQFGCLDEGLTPCDWSAKAFATRAVGHFDEQRQDAYEWCTSVLPGFFHTHLGSERVIIDAPSEMEPPAGKTCSDPAAPDICFADCVVSIPNTLRPGDLEDIVAEQEACEALLPDFHAALAAHQAHERVSAIEELVDASTGEYKLPSRLQGRTEEKGNKYFGLEYGYEYGFDTGLEDGLCDFRFIAGGDFHVTARALSYKKDLVDVAAWVRTDTSKVEARAEVLGIELFDGVDETIPQFEPLEVDLVSDSKRIKKSWELGSLRVWAGPVPLKISAGISGSAGYDLSVKGTLEGLGANDGCPQASITGGIEPTMNISGFVEAGVDIVIAAAGILGELTIIEIGVPVDVEVGLALTPPPPGSQALNDLEFFIDTSMRVDLETLSGRIALYGEVGFCPGLFCKRGEKTLVNWDGLRWNKPIFDQTYSVYVGDLLSVLGGGL